MCQVTILFVIILFGSSEMLDSSLAFALLSNLRACRIGRGGLKDQQQVG